jgi:hypothetical protein
MIPSLPKNLCRQSILLRLSKEKDRWQKPIIEQEVLIKHMIFQQETIYSGTKNNRKKRAAGILFLFSGVSDPLPEITPEYLGSEIEYEGHLFTLEKITVNKNPFSSEVYSYELEVI